MYRQRYDKFFEKKHEIDYKPETMYQMLKNYACRHENSIAYEFQGKKTRYAEFLNRIELVAKGLTAIGIRENDVVTICMPNCPQAIDTFYAINRIGAVANMIHPLSAQSEITFYLNISKSKVILTLDQFYEKVVEARRDCEHQ
ncbi:MAG TPA: class I adenylate-forming enzyme family protein, partial [Erysipelotrichaceae bacterium]|nr:class I adenylate-forming enzyme family protein [Erysipelotrichaceae bacterium]